MTILAHETDRHSHQPDAVVEVDVATRDHLDTLKQMHRHYFAQQVEREGLVDRLASELKQVVAERDRLRRTTSALQSAIELVALPGDAPDYSDLYEVAEWTAA